MGIIPPARNKGANPSPLLSLPPSTRTNGRTSICRCRSSRSLRSLASRALRSSGDSSSSFFLRVFSVYGMECGVRRVERGVSN